MFSKTADSILFRRGACRAFAGASFLAALAGCQAPVPRHASGVFAGQGGLSSNVVFSGPEVVAAAPPEGPELTRNDDRIAIRPPETAYEQAAFASPTQPNIFRPYYLWLRTSTNEQIYFRPEYRQGIDSRTTYWGY